MTTEQFASTISSNSIVEDKRVEVTVEGETAIIRMSTYAEGIGWFVQKSISLDAEMLDTLCDQIAAARGALRRECDDVLAADLLEL